MILGDGKVESAFSMKPSLSLKLLAVLASSLVIATAARPQTVPPVEVKFMTYNVQAPGWNQNRRAQVVSGSPDTGPEPAARTINNLKLYILYFKGEIYYKRIFTDCKCGHRILNCYERV